MLSRRLPVPFLLEVSTKQDRVLRDEYPFSIPVFREGISVAFSGPVTYFVGENGSGKSSLLEALAWAAGFGALGGGRDHRSDTAVDGRKLGASLRLTWRVKAPDGFFFRAETLFNLATVIESVGSDFARYGGRSLHTQSHGEAFLALMRHRFGPGLFLLDEPEAALSPSRQLAFLALVHDLAVSGQTQLIMATHSPILLSYPGAQLISLDDGKMVPVAYEETEHFRLVRDFLNAPERYHRELFGTGSDRGVE